MNELRRKVLLLAVLSGFILVALIGVTGVQLKKAIGEQHQKLASVKSNNSIMYQP
ncbi:hypothetical protein Echvi_2183 [Echinicola vietnamensis DSM 17526]|uniref:Uncharacterized protein n=1 Tax=Echinicola vietnamensis (strain DSM 17526 / LMG 23754 / KMM 6221) TaxID=926556 RepID=L0FX02_ECHVK|nr:hypothetical protein Echvi_2183 [Echinicola vietnamensis DSM 17526]